MLLSNSRSFNLCYIINITYRHRKIFNISLTSSEKTSKFIGKTGDEISDEDYYDYLDYIVYSGEQKYKGQE